MPFEYQIIEKELWSAINTPEGRLTLPHLPIYQSRLASPTLFIWTGEEAVRCKHKRAFGEVVEFSVEVPVAGKKDLNLDYLEDSYEYGSQHLDTKVQEAIHKTALAARDAVVVLPGEEAYVRVVNFIKAHLWVMSTLNGFVFMRNCAIVAEGFPNREKDNLGSFEVPDCALEF